MFPKLETPNNFNLLERPGKKSVNHRFKNCMCKLFRFQRCKERSPASLEAKLRRNSAWASSFLGSFSSWKGEQSKPVILTDVQPLKSMIWIWRWPCSKPFLDGSPRDEYPFFWSTDNMEAYNTVVRAGRNLNDPKQIQWSKSVSKSTAAILLCHLVPNSHFPFTPTTSTPRYWTKRSKVLIQVTWKRPMLKEPYVHVRNASWSWWARRRWPWTSPGSVQEVRRGETSDLEMAQEKFGKICTKWSIRDTYNDSEYW